MAEPQVVTDADLELIDLGLDPNEASGLCAIQSDALLDRLGWTFGLWTVLDDGPIERCIAAIGKLADPTDEDLDGAHDGWVVRRLLPPTPPGGFPATDDGEAIAVRDGVVYAFGSLYGAKEGPLEAERQFLARFHEDAVQPLDPGDLDDRPDDSHDPITAPLEVVEDRFRLHRAINDALRASGLPLLEPGPTYRKHVIGEARKRAIDAGRDWAWRLRWDDHAINVEGSAFFAAGALVLGLRIPVHADGHPLLVVVEGIERAFEDVDAAPRVVGVHVVANVGEPAAPVGVRDCMATERSLHVLVGNLDSAGKGSRLLDVLPEGARAVSSEWHIDLANGELPSAQLGAVPDRIFPDLHRVEGLARDRDGRTHYVVDEDEAVGLRIAPPRLERGEGSPRNPAADDDGAEADR